MKKRKLMLFVARTTSAGTTTIVETVSLFVRFQENSETHSIILLSDKNKKV